MAIDWSTDLAAAPRGTDVLLHFDWEDMTVVGFFGPDTEEPGSRATWRVKWDHDALDGGYDEPTHWAHINRPEKT